MYNNLENPISYSNTKGTYLNFDLVLTLIQVSDVEYTLGDLVIPKKIVLAWMQALTKMSLKLYFLGCVEIIGGKLCTNIA